MKELKRGAFIVIEGIDGAGKTTAIESAGALLRDLGYDVLETSVSLGTPYSKACMDILKSGLGEDSRHLEQALLCASAKAHVYRNVIEPAVKANKIVIVDRFHLSTKMYQYLCTANNDLVGLTVPWGKIDWTIILDVAPEVGRARIKSRLGKGEDHLDMASFDEVTRRRKIMLDWYYANSEKANMICASTSADIVCDRVVNEIEKFAYQYLM